MNLPLDDDLPIRPVPQRRFRYRIDKDVFRVRYENEDEHTVDIVIERKVPFADANPSVEQVEAAARATYPDYDAMTRHYREACYTEALTAMKRDGWTMPPV